ncbi:hypothetical protein [Pseudomonas donghuensis]|uniref:hypothetical protein n=1 Tax=Pseudomonas donghuensis TaxID=1163398 RepID=UPI00215F8DF1|nr:hypothetical protein [Pseudomonas donghuensis]UVL23720.1 hypothetical protein LOY30_23370 [Pseudomonas donghuensis]
MGYPLNQVGHLQWDQQVETSEDKTKRKFAKYLVAPIWNYQYSVFYDTPEDSKNLLDDQKMFRQELRRKYPDQPFLVRLQTLKSHRRGNVFQAYLTMYTTTKVEGLQKLADRCFPSVMNVIYRQITPDLCEVKAHKILTQQPHNLTKLFGEVRVRRYGVINKNLLADIETEVEDPVIN